MGFAVSEWSISLSWTFVEEKDSFVCFDLSGSEVSTYNTTSLRS